MDTYWSECAIPVGDSEVEDVVENTQEPEFQEVDWFHATGFSSFVDPLVSGKEIEEKLIETAIGTLPEHQAAAVRKRINTLSATVRLPNQKRHGMRRRDIRDVFSDEVGSGCESRSRSNTPDSLDESEELLERIDRVKPREEDIITINVTAKDSVDVKKTQKDHLGLNLINRFSDRLCRSASPTSITFLHSFPDTKTEQCGSESNNNSVATTPEPSKDVSDGILRRVHDNRRRSLSQGQKLNDKHNHACCGEATPTDGQNIFGGKGVRKIRGDVALEEINKSGIQVLRYNNYGTIYMHGYVPRPMSFDEVNENQTHLDSRSWITLVGYDDSSSPGNAFKIDTLPAAELLPCSDGTTKLFHLSRVDQIKLQRLALLELTSILDLYHLDLDRRRIRVRHKHNGNNVFGVGLDSLLEKEMKIDPDRKMPVLLDQLLSNLYKRGTVAEGVLRLAPNQQRLLSLRSQIEAGQEDVGIILANTTPHELAALLKQWLRELPVPILGGQHLKTFFKISDLPDLYVQLQVLNLLLLLVPLSHLHSLDALLSFLFVMVSNVGKTRMPLSNVAMIMAPNLFPQKWFEAQRAKKNIENQMQVATVTCRLTELLINFSNVILNVPPSLLRQLRHQNQIAQKLQNIPQPIQITKATPLSVFVVTPQLNRRQQIHLSPDTTAQSLVQTLMKDLAELAEVAEQKSTTAKDQQGRRQRRPIAELPRNVVRCLLAPTESHSIHEIGGNLCERELDNETKLLSVLQINPSATFHMKCHHKTCDHSSAS